MNQAYLLNSLWMRQCRRETRALCRATRNVKDAQQRVLREIVVANQNTDFGHTHQFQRIEDVRGYQRRVPASDYEDYGGYIERIAAGEQHVLTADPVRLLEPTSGTTRAEKLIPYTEGLRRQFQRGVAAWIGDLFYQRPEIRRGRAYWSISPAMDRQRTTPGGIPIGFDDDTAYLSRLQRRLVTRLLAVPPVVARQKNLDEFRYQTLLHLFSAPDLALISIWSPTFLGALFCGLSSWSERLTDDIRRGRSGLHPAAARADQLQQILAGDQPLGEKLRRIWPRLDTVSCWADATAAGVLPDAKRLLPHAEFQGKGLIATEAFVTLPVVSQPGGVLALRSHFFEFEAVDVATPGSDLSQPVNKSDSRRIVLAHQLRMGRAYRVLVTTAGGLYRYHLHDIVEVVGFVNRCPLLRLLCKSNHHSDLVGEKLGEGHVRQAVDNALRCMNAAADFSMLVPSCGARPGYCLYVQGLRSLSCSVTGESLQRLASAVEAGLCENPYYRHAIALGQLAPVQVRRLDTDGESAAHVYLRQMVARGFRLGNVKPVALDAWPGWSGTFDALAVHESVDADASLHTPPTIVSAS